VSALRQACDDYLALRRATGFVLNRHGRMLPDLVAHLEAAGLATITTSAALEWATRPPGHPQEWASRLSVARGFARYLSTLDGIAEVPPTDLLPGCPPACSLPVFRRGDRRVDGGHGHDLLPGAGRDLSRADRAAGRDRDADR